MISYNLKTLSNGLTLIHHEDRQTNLCVTNILYNVGARDENPEKTGFAHLFEHLMFGGSINIPSFDTPLQKASGENNAFTSNDITNYYITIPAENVETAMWLESDRMLSLDFSEKSLNVQRGVVIEEFRQRYLNQPYGDAMLELRPLTYSKHPYQWATIGKEIGHIENAKLEDVVAFFKKFYNPSNAVLCIAGNISLENAVRLTEKWFGDIPSGEKNQNQYEDEPVRLSRVEKTIVSDVPQNALFMSFLMVDRKHPLYFAFDLLSDMLSGSESSRFVNQLIKEKGLFTHISAYISGELDKGMFIIEGRLSENVAFEEAEKAVIDLLSEMLNSELQESELNKVKNKVITSNLFAKTSVLNKAMALCYAYLMGDANLVNTEIEKLKNIKTVDIKTILKDYLLKNNQSVLKYIKK